MSGRPQADRYSTLLLKEAEMFKMNKMLLAVAATLLASQAVAAPVTPANIASARANNKLQETWISGASAPTFNVFQGFVAGCDANSVSTFNTDASLTALRPGSAGDYLAYACTRGGKVSVVYHTVAGGSFNAFAPHVPNDVDGDGTVGTTKLDRIKKIDSNTCVLQSGTFALTNQSAITSYGSCTTVVPANNPDGAIAKPAGGFSDVESALFGVTDTSTYGTEGEALIGQVFGVAVSINLYRALQVEQGIYPDVATAAANDSSFDPAKAPSVSSAAYASLVTGNTASWSILLPNDSSANAGKVNIARRVPTSGTQASSNAYFLKNPCNGDPSLLGKLFPVSAADSTSDFVVTEGSGTSDAKKKLTTSQYAIGIISLENNWRTESKTDRNGYRFVKLDGIHPEAPIAGSGAAVDDKARYTAAQGNYPFHMEMRTFVANSADTFGASLINQIKSTFGTLACSDIPRGLTLNPLSGSSCTPGQVVSRVTRSGNNCQAPVFVF